MVPGNKYCNSELGVLGPTPDRGTLGKSSQGLRLGGLIGRQDVCQPHLSPVLTFCVSMSCEQETACVSLPPEQGLVCRSPGLQALPYFSYFQQRGSSSGEGTADRTPPRAERNGMKCAGNSTAGQTQGFPPDCRDLFKVFRARWLFHGLLVPRTQPPPRAAPWLVLLPHLLFVLPQVPCRCEEPQLREAPGTLEFSLVHPHISS